MRFYTPSLSTQCVPTNTIGFLFSEHFFQPFERLAGIQIGMMRFLSKAAEESPVTTDCKRV